MVTPMKKTYSEKLRDPRWQKMRLQIMERDKFTCLFCSSTEKPLNVHHKYYDKGAEPWEYAQEVLVTCCEECHESLEDLKKEIGLFIGSSYGKRLMDTFLLLCEKDRLSFDFIMSEMAEIGPDIFTAFGSVINIYYGGYEKRRIEEEGE